MPVDVPLCTAKSNKSITVFLFEQVEQTERGLPVDGVVQFALGVQPAHALLTIAGDQRTLDRTSGAALRTRGQALLPTGFPHSILHGGLFSDGYVSLNIAYASAG